MCRGIVVNKTRKYLTEFIDEHTQRRHVGRHWASNPAAQTASPASADNTRLNAARTRPVLAQPGFRVGRLKEVSFSTQGRSLVEETEAHVIVALGFLLFFLLLLSLLVASRSGGGRGRGGSSGGELAGVLKEENLIVTLK